MGFHKPTTTQTPDALFDYWQTRLTGAEMRVLLYAVRRTYGFKKDDDNISLDQFERGITTADGEVLDEGCGISRKSILRAIKLLMAKGLLVKTRRRDENDRDEVSNFRLHVVDERRPRPERGFHDITTTQVPDDLFDHWLPRLSDTELFVLLYVVRRTLGFRKAADVIAPDQFLNGVRTRGGAVLDEGCGVSRKHLYLALKGLEEKGLIRVQRRRSRHTGNIPSVFSLVFESDMPDILNMPAGGLDPRASFYDPGADPTVGAPDRPSADGENGGRAATADRGANGLQEEGRTTLRGGHHDDKREAGRRLERGESTTRGAHRDDDGVANGHPEGRAATSREWQTALKGYASYRAPQQTVLEEQQTDGQETGTQQTERQGDAISKASNGLAGEENRSRHPLYSALVSQWASDLSLLFHDQDHQRSNRTRALRLWAESGLDEQTFVEMMQEARLIALKRGNIAKEATDGTSAPAGSKNRMPYFFAVLEDLVGMALANGGAAGATMAGERESDTLAAQHDSAAPDASARPLVAPSHHEHARGSRQQKLAASGHGAVAEVAHDAGSENEVWSALLRELRLVLVRENYDTWLGPTYVLEQVGNMLRVAVPGAFHKDWLESKLHRRLAQALDRVGQADVQIEYVVVPERPAEGRP